MLRPKIDGICDGCPFEEMTIENLPIDDIFICCHFPACVRVKSILDKKQKGEVNIPPPRRMNVEDYKRRNSHR